MTDVPHRVESGERVARLESELSAGSSGLSFAQLISAIYKHVTGLPNTQPPPQLPLSVSFCDHPYDLLIQFSPEGFFIFTHLQKKLVACRKLFTPD